MFPSVFQQIPLLRAYTASREAFVSCSPPHPSVTSSLGLQPPSCEKPSLQLLWKIIWRLLLLVLVEKAKSWSLSTHDTVNFYHIFSKSLLICLAKKKKKKNNSQGSCSLPRTLWLHSKFFQFFCIVSEVWGPSAAHWIFMAYTNHRLTVIFFFWFVVCSFPDIGFCWT